MRHQRAGIALNMTAPSRPPHLTCCYVGVAFSNMYSQAAYPGGAFRKGLLEDWFKNAKFDPKTLELIRAHPNYDDFWKSIDPEQVASQVNVPTMFVGGWYDIFKAGSIDSFATINKQGDVGARGKCRLVMEAYGHGRNEDLVFPNAGTTPGRRRVEMVRHLAQERRQGNRADSRGAVLRHGRPGRPQHARQQVEDRR